MARTQWLTWIGAMASIVMIGALQTGCTQTECGTGTIDKAGQCVPSTDPVSGASCGPGTTLNKATNKCEADFDPTVCGDNTEPQKDPTTGVTTCVGTGGGGCSAPITCGSATTGKMSICGQLVDIETSAPIAAAGATGTACNPAAPTADGPCSMRMRVYNAIDFAGNPATAPELTRDELVINDCGQFRVKNINPAGAQFIGLGIDDNPTVTQTHRVTGIAMPFANGKAVTGFPGYSVRVTTDQKWTTTAGLSGNTFVQRGVYVAIFLHGQVPVSGAKIKINGAVESANDYYFTDASPASRATVDSGSQAATGANGTGLLLGHPGELTAYTGGGGETTNCSWPTDNGDQLPGIAFVQPRVEVQTAAPTMLCP